MSRFKKILIGMVVVALIFVVGFVGTVIYLQSKSAEAKNNNNQVKKYKVVVYTIKNAIVSNLKDSDKNIRVSVGLEIRDENKDDQKFTDGLKQDDLAITQTIITILRSKTIDEVSDPDALSKVGKEVTSELNRAYGTDRFITTYFEEFIIQ